jgi:hypothetical protein
MLVTADSKSNRGAHVHLPRRIRLNEGYTARQSDTSFGIGKDHRIPLAELQSVSPKQVNELDSYQGLGWGAAAMGEKGFGNSRVSKRGQVFRHRICHLFIHGIQRPAFHAPKTPDLLLNLCIT